MAESKKSEYRILEYKDFRPSLQKLYRKGGPFQNAANKILASLKGFDLQLTNEPFDDLRPTKNGESRIPHCTKYDLIGECRLVTIRQENIFGLLFAGIHSDADEWILKNKGLSLALKDDKTLIPIKKSEDIKQGETRISPSFDFSDGKLYKKIPERYFDDLILNVPRSLCIKLEQLESSSTELEILEIAIQITDIDQRNAVYDTFCKLLSSDVDGAKASVDLYKNKCIPLEEVPTNKIEEVLLNGDLIDFTDFEPEMIEHYLKTASFHQWMLLLHPQQKQVVEKDFNGPAKLIGVSGSGKTSIIVKRAIRLSQKYPSEKILILTLNRSLAKLINELIIFSCPPDQRLNIEVLSFWNLCLNELKNYEKVDHERYYNDVTWKNNEHISEIWREFYRCENNNDEANKMIETHIHLNQLSILPEEYLYQEFDYIRSSFGEKERAAYLNNQREGRLINLQPKFRKQIIEGLKSWEEFMMFVGITDYLGLSTALYRHIDKIKPKYRSILVDEVQDFGTIELKIIRKIVSENENDLFLSGDLAQQVSTKPPVVFARSGINVLGRSLQIKKNYRNAREILEAAHAVVKNAIENKLPNSEDLEVMEPEYANFSSPRPRVLFCDSLEQEIVNSIAYLNVFLENHLNAKVCIAICGFTLFEIKKLGKQLSLPVLDGDITLDEKRMFLSDLEQTKGFEFDAVVVLNANDSIFPNPILPKEEWFRDLAKFYVTMTRAKQDLVISYSEKLSHFIQLESEYFVFSTWEDYVGIQEKNESIKLNEILNDDNNNKIDLNISGIEYIKSRHALGMSIDLQQKIIDVVTGSKRGYFKGQREYQETWQSIYSLIKHDSNQRLQVVNRFGSVERYNSFVEWFKKHR